jgi:hypothetical protein
MVTFALIAGLTRHRKASLGRRGNRAGSKFLGFGGLCLRIIINMSLLPAPYNDYLSGLVEGLAPDPQQRYPSDSRCHQRQCSPYQFECDTF